MIEVLHTAFVVGLNRSVYIEYLSTPILPTGDMCYWRGQHGFDRSKVSLIKAEYNRKLQRHIEIIS